MFCEEVRGDELEYFCKGILRICKIFVIFEG